MDITAWIILSCLILCVLGSCRHRVFRADTFCYQQWQYMKRQQVCWDPTMKICSFRIGPGLLLLLQQFNRKKAALCPGKNLHCVGKQAKPEILSELFASCMTLGHICYFSGCGVFHHKMQITSILEIGNDRENKTQETDEDLNINLKEPQKTKVGAPG